MALCFVHLYPSRETESLRDHPRKYRSTGYQPFVLPDGPEAGLDALAPIHIELLRELLRRREKHEKGGGEHNTSTRELAIKLHLQDLEQLRLAGLSDEIPHVFSEKPD